MHARTSWAPALTAVLLLRAHCFKPSALPGSALVRLDQVLGPQSGSILARPSLGCARGGWAMLEKDVAFSTPSTPPPNGLKLRVSGRLVVVELECVLETDVPDLESQVSSVTIGKEFHSAKPHS